MTNGLEQELRDMETLVAAMLTPLKGQPLRLFVRAFTGHAMRQAPEGAPWLDALAEALSEAGREINREVLHSGRPNEAGNRIEPFVKKALNRLGFEAGTPQTRGGGRQSSGYPDIEVRGWRGDASVRFYLECKTYNPANADSTLRSFYLSPPLSKITMDAAHLLVAFRMEAGAESERRDGANRYHAREWRLLDLYDLRVDVKHEIHTSNRALYTELAPVRQGRVR